MKAAIYLRVSTADQVEKFSLPAQKKMLTEYCERQGWTFTLYEDAGISGETIEARPAFRKLLKDAEAKRFDVALAVEMERFSRSTDLFDWLQIRQTFRKAGIKFGTPAQLFDPDDLEDRFLSILFGALAAREKEKFVARSMRGKAEATRQGRYVGSRAPFGYHVDGGALLVKEEEAKVVRRAFLLARSGLSVCGIRDLFSREGVPTPAAMRGSMQAGKAWWAGPISEILRDSTYTGEAQWNGIAFKVPPIVDAGEFEATQKILAERAKTTDKHARRVYPLSGLLFCAECGVRLYGEAMNKGRNRYYAHRLDKFNSKSKCHRWRADRLEKAVSAEAMKILMAPETIAKLAKGQSKFTGHDEVLLRLDVVADQIAKLPAARERITDAYEEGTIDKAEWKRRLSNQEDRKARLEGERDTLKAQAGQQTANETETKQVAELISRYEGMVILHTTTLQGEPIDTAARLRGIVPDLKVADLRTLIRKVTVKLDGSLRFEGLVPLRQQREVESSSA